MPSQEITIAQALSMAASLNGVSDTPRLDSELLLSFASGLGRTYFYTWPEKPLSQAVANDYIALLARRKKGEPIAHITGRREFWSLNLHVNASTLIPRPDTEVLVEVALKYMPIHTQRILDLGTGTGAVALALASELPEVRVYAVDQSAEAVALARRNVESLALPNVVVDIGSWYDQDYLTALCIDANFDVIVSNPPYINAADPHLCQGDVRFEPRSALVAENLGFADIEAIASVAVKLLNKNGMLWLEHGWQQAQAVCQILTKAGFHQVRTVNDYGGNPRVSGGVVA